MIILNLLSNTHRLRRFCAALVQGNRKTQKCFNQSMHFVAKERGFRRIKLK
jgi:hypothetical protein